MAKYIFRGLEVFNFNEKTKQLRIGREAWLCAFIIEDFSLMIKFIADCECCVKGEMKIVDDIEVG